jgi:hypothetical protein
MAFEESTNIPFLLCWLRLSTSAHKHEHTYTETHAHPYTIGKEHELQWTVCHW